MSKLIAFIKSASHVVVGKKGNYGLIDVNGKRHPRDWDYEAIEEIDAIASHVFIVDNDSPLADTEGTRWTS